MKWILESGVYALVLCQVLTAPSSRVLNGEGDTAEQELIRNHHSAALERLKARVNQASSEAEESSPVESIEEVVGSEDDDDSSVTDDDLYDITVGDVIRDVLLTLRDHPEIVKELIASEKAKLAKQIDAFNSLVDEDSTGESLAGFMKPAEQLNSVPKSIEKKTGRSGMAVIPGNNGQMAEDKRADEVINDEYTRDTDTVESQQYNDFMHQPREGGQDDPMFDYEKSNSKVTDGTDSEDWSSASEIEQDSTGESVLDSDKINGIPTSNSATENVRVQDNSRDKNFVKAVSRDGQADDTESNENDDSEDLNSEEELAWLLRRGHTRQSGEQTNSDSSNSDKHYSKM